MSDNKESYWKHTETLLPPRVFVVARKQKGIRRGERYTEYLFLPDMQWVRALSAATMFPTLQRAKEYERTHPNYYILSGRFTSRAKEEEK